MNTILNQLDRLMMAITFAEANEPELAQECVVNLKPIQAKRFPQDTKTATNHLMTNQTAH
ncbi:MAG: hypothetical protein KKH22_11000 [Proteobacteria bacterium]|nr:hypothetical protein [Pseudomonadota bacterium]